MLWAGREVCKIKMIKIQENNRNLFTVTTKVGKKSTKFMKK